ncbi:MAG: MFS transporter [Microlunatus sp.]|nr:MFS transporter [Microlunatus sp.]
MTTSLLTRNPGAEPGLRGLRRWAPLPVLMIATTMAILDFFIVNVAVPDIQAELDTGPAAVEWVVAGYGLTMAIFLIAGGRLADRIGRRLILGVGITIFALASLGCGLAPSAGALITARLVQGVGGALMSPTVLAIIGALYAGADRRRALGVFGMVMGLAAVCGQLIGGLLIDADILGTGWRAIFLINLPLSALALGLLRIVPESRAAVRRRIDILGLMLVGVALAAIMLALVQGREQGWPLWSWLSLAGAALLLAAAVLQQRRLAGRGDDPLFDPAAFASRNVRAGLLAMLIYQSNQPPLYLILALYLQQGRGLGPIGSGLVFSVLAAGYLITSLPAPGLTHRYGRRVLMAAAGLLVIGYAILAGTLAVIGTGGAVIALLPALLIIGLGQGLGLNSLTTLVIAGADPEHVSAVAGVQATVQQVGSALGVAAIGLVFFGLAGHGAGSAFAISAVVLGALMITVGLLAGLLPRTSR